MPPLLPPPPPLVSSDVVSEVMSVLIVEMSDVSIENVSVVGGVVVAVFVGAVGTAFEATELLSFLSSPPERSRTSTTAIAMTATIAAPITAMRLLLLPPPGAPYGAPGPPGLGGGGGPCA